jgi:hypothetical protein
MDEKFSYYYNRVPGANPSRNNLIYTSLISKDKRTFVQWYYNDLTYHKNQNQVVDASLMEEKWTREITYLTQMQDTYPNMVPKILEIDTACRKIYLEVSGPDFWQQALDNNCAYDDILPDWQDQMIEIVKAHRAIGVWKYSMHPSSYFVVNGRLKSINYFFAYHQSEPLVSIKDVESHIYSTRQDEIRKHLASLNIVWDEPQSWETMNTLSWQSFSNMYPLDFIEKIKCIT